MGAENQKYRKYTERHQTDIKKLTVKNILSKYSNLGPFFSTASHFGNTRLSKIRKKKNK